MHATREYLRHFERYSSNQISPDLQIALAPSFLSLTTALCWASEFPAIRLKVVAQTARCESSGALSGYVSASQLLESGIDTVLCGHSERRQYAGETDSWVGEQVKGLISQEIAVVACVGESLMEYEADQTARVLERQLAPILDQCRALSADALGQRLIIAYEPVWAIGTGRTATPEIAHNAHTCIRDLLAASWGELDVPILYGGSVNRENLEALLATPGIDGALVGGASLDPQHFWDLVQISSRALGAS